VKVAAARAFRFAANEKDLHNAFIQVQYEVVGSPIFGHAILQNTLVI
jgi:hypothetical protein